MWIVKDLEIWDFNIYENSVAVFNNKEKALAYFNQLVSNAKSDVKKYNLYVDADDTYKFEAWKEYASNENAIYIDLEETEVNK